MELLEKHIKALMKLMKRLFTYCLIIVLVLIAVLVIFIVLKLYKDRIGWLVFNILLILVFSTEFVYGFFKYYRFKWVLNNYQSNKEKCIKILTTMRKSNINFLPTIENDDEFPFSVKISFHLKRAIDYLTDI